MLYVAESSTMSGYMLMEADEEPTREEVRRVVYAGFIGRCETDIDERVDQFMRDYWVYSPDLHKITKKATAIKKGKL